MSRALQKFSAAVFIVGAVVVYGLVEYFPAVPHSVLGWAALVFLGVPLLILAEAVAEWFHRRQFYRKWPSVIRIAFGVVAVLVFAALLFWPFTIVIKLIES
jgi:hypothetical protein